jgi:putative ABC transport system permease protein
MFQDIRLAIRSAVRSPALTSVILISLALGIGANTTIFTLINAVFLRPLPVKDPARLAQVFTVMPKSSAYQTLSLANYRDFRDNVSEFSGLAAYQGIGANIFGGSEPVSTGGQLVTGNYFQVLGVEAAYGRTFTPEEDKVLGAAPVMVMSDGLWKRAFASDPAVVGKTVTLNGFTFAVIGIMPPEFKGLQVLGSVDFWVPLAMHEQLVTGETARTFYIARNSLVFQVVGRMKPGVSLDRVRQAMKTMAKRLEEQYPRENEGRSVEVFPLTEAALGVGGRDDLVRSGGLLLSATGLVLLIACGNVASLLLARAMARRQEIAVRLSVGAPRWRLVRQLLAESGVLAVVGGLAGILLAYWGRDLLWSFRPSGMRADFLDLSLEPRVLWFTVALSIGTGILFGLIPAVQGSRLDLLSAIKSQADTPQRLSRWTLGLDLRGALVTGQVALSLVALIGAGLFLRSLQEAQRINPGFRTDGLAVMFVNAGAQGYSPERGMQFYREVVERVAQVPGVQSVSWGEAVPQFSGSAASRRVFPEGRELPQELLSLFVPFDGIWPGYFRTVGIPLLKGRDFTEADREGTDLVAIVNETTARLFWPGADPVGKRFKHRLNPNFFTVIGVARDAKYGGLGSTSQPPHLYYAALQYYTPAMTLCVRTSGNPQPVLPAVHQVIRQLDKTMPLPPAFTMPEVLRRNMWTARLGAMLLAVFGVLAVTLTSVGIYGVMAYSVTRRTKEIGIRMALGAEHADVLRMVFRQGVKLTSVGVAIGLGVALVATRLIGNLLFVSPTDGRTYVAISLLMAVVAMAASFLPARRASRVDPLMALRHER